MTRPCRHCGTPSPSDAEFCCVGCEAVWHALNTALSTDGLETFYVLQAGAGVPVGDDLGSRRSWEPECIDVGDGSVRVKVGLDGVHCAGCVWLVERMPQMIDGVVDARLNLGRGRVELRWDPTKTTFGELSRWLGRFGYSPYPLDERRGDEQERRERGALVQVGVSWALAANVMLITVALYAGLDPVADGGLWAGARWLAMLLSGASLAYGGREFLRRAIASVRPFRGFSRLGVDVPVSVGLVVGWAYSAYNTVHGVGEVWFDTVAVLIAALLTARWLHARGLRIAADATNRLASLLPRIARRVDAGGDAEEVMISELQAGDLVEVRTGDVVPADGIVESGMAQLDRALLTGESAPEGAAPGTCVWAGETATRGALRVRVDTIGEKTRFGQLARWVLDGENRGGATVQLADRLAGWFVGAILVGAVATAIWASFVAPSELVPRVVALLVVSCPCALGMATPLAFSVAVGRAARRGIFVRTDGTLELLPTIDAVVLDKTGTLTRGVMRVSEWTGDEQALALAAALERSSAHPIAGALAPWDEGLDVTAFDEEVGRGVSGIVDGHTVEVCAADRRGGETPIEIFVDGVSAARVRVSDELRLEARELVESLHARGVDVWIASGDHADVVDRIAQRVGVGQRRALHRQSPERKLALVRKLRTDGRVVAMIGDGVNDAGALREADVGIAVGGSADVTATAADVLLGRSGLEPLVELREYADDAMRAVRRNLVLSAVYNVAALTAAAAGLVTPLAAAIAMPLSSIAVVVSSLAQGNHRRFAKSPGFLQIHSGVRHAYRRRRA